VPILRRPATLSTRQKKKLMEARHRNTAAGHRASEKACLGVAAGLVEHKMIKIVGLGVDPILAVVISGRCKVIFSG
jgi:hypothetical protein